MWKSRGAALEAGMQSFASVQELATGRFDPLSFL
jgi:hypothetical protein